MTNKAIPPAEQALLEHASQRTGWYTTVLTRVWSPGTPEEKALQAGSATFVRVAQVFGLVTARHVAELFEGGWHLGLALVSEAHTFAVRPEYLDIIHVGTGPVECHSPDLSFIRIHEPFVGTTRAYKSFYGLDPRPDLHESPAPDNLGEAWFLYGAPAIDTSEEPPEGRFAQVRGYHAICGGVVVEPEDDVDGFDFVSAVVQYSDATTTPYDFHGVSGGGLWRAKLAFNDDGGIDDYDYVLSGVAVCQSRIEEGERYIRCHGPKSLYQDTLAVIRAKCA